MSDDIRFDPSILSRLEVFGDMFQAKQGAADIEVEIQDDGRTMKIWITPNQEKYEAYRENLRASFRELM